MTTNIFTTPEAPNPISEEEARNQGLKPLTSGYSRFEQSMLQNVIADLRRGQIAFALVRTPVGTEVEVWRHPNGMRCEPDQGDFQ